MNKNEYINYFLKILDSYDDYIKFGIKQKHLKYKIDISQNNDNGLNKNSLNLNRNIEQNIKKIINLAELIIKCTKCPLYNFSNKISGAGNPNSKIFIISIQPNIENEKTSLPINDREYDYLKKWLNAINIDIEEVFITNLIKCVPKKNNITKDIINACRIYLNEQLDIIKPSIILTLGQITLSSLKQSRLDLKNNHGNIFYYNKIPFIPTYHPKDVLLNQDLKKSVWADLKILKNFIENRMV